MYYATNISKDDRKVYNTVLERFDHFFKVRKMSSSEEPTSTDGVRETLNQPNNSLRAGRPTVSLTIAHTAILKIWW